MRYDRNRIYITASEQARISGCRLFLGGSGIGSVIAECALRLGFEHITIVDGDHVEESNLNRQNYLQSDVGDPKAEAIARRLRLVHPGANIVTHPVFLDGGNLGSLLSGHDIAINALDFQSDVPFRFDAHCQEAGIPVLHPYNLGWAALLFVIMPGGPALQHLSASPVGFERSVVSHFLGEEARRGREHTWLRDVLAAYVAEGGALSPPQLSAGSWLLAGLCTDVLFRLATGKSIRAFPDYYFLTAQGE